MSVTRTPSTSSTAASDRLAMAIAAARPAAGAAASADAGTRTGGERAPGRSAAKAPSHAHDHAHTVVAEGARPETRRPSTRSSSRPTSDAARGAKAAPTSDATGASAADEGARNLGPASSAGAATTPYTPYQASSDAYAARSAAQPQQARSNGSSRQAASAPVRGTGAWSPEWQARFERLQLAPADIAYLASGGFDAATLADIEAELRQVPVLEPGAPRAGHEAGSVGSADGPTAADVAPAGQPGFEAQPATGSAWSPEWERRFGELMQRMGMSKDEVKAQLQGARSQPTSEEQLTEAYRQMEASLGDFDDAWRTKFTKLMGELRTPAAERDHVLQQLAGGGLTEAQLSEAYRQMQASKPAWNDDWENKFGSLDVPKDMLKQLRGSGAPKEALEQQFRKLLDTKMEYQRDGRLKKLQDAKATPEEKWGVMLEGKKGKDFDKLVEQIHSSHVSGWKRIGSFALNLVPGVYALQFITGKDWVTGEKIDRSNPLNIVGAVASGFAGFTAVRSAVQGVQGLSAASRAASSTMQAANAGKTASLGLSASVKAMGSASPLSGGALQAIEGAGLVAKFEKGLRFTDYLKSALPLANRFGEAGRLSAVGRGYYQGMQLAAGTAALRGVEGGGVAVDKATRATMLGELRQGKGISDALAAAGRTGRAGDFAVDAAHVARDYNRYGFLQGTVGRGVDGARVARGSGNFRFNPFRSHATIGSTSNPNVFSLGRGVNFGTNGGLAQGIGAVRGANLVGIGNPGTAANAGLHAQAAARAGEANQLVRNSSAAGRMSGITMADDVQRIETVTKTAEWAKKLGVAGDSRFRTLFQLGGSNRSAARVAGMVENGGSGGYRAARHAGDLGRRFGGFVATPLVAGATVGLTGRQMQPGWEYLQNRSEIRAEEAKAREAAKREQAELEQLYREQQTAGTGGTSDAREGAATTPAAEAPQVVGTSPTTGGQLVFDPSIGAVYDVTSGDVYDPSTGELVGNLSQQQPAGRQAATPATAPGTAGVQPAATPSGAAEVYVDPQTGYYVDPASGLMADPATGNVYDPRSGVVVGNVNQPTR